VALVGSGVGLAVVAGGPVFVVLRQVHRWATYVVTPVLVGHIVIASGVLPGYRGVARAMHGGRLRVAAARRVWPGWTRQRLVEPVADRGSGRDGLVGEEGGDGRDDPRVAEDAPVAQAAGEDEP
jgi:formate dehydrogenase subunit gamma